MWRKNKKKKYYKKSNYYNKDEWKEAFLLIVFIVAIFLFLWFIFWLWVFLLVYLIFLLIHKANNKLDLYNTKYYYWAIISFIIWILIILFWWGQIAYNMWKINNTFWGWAVESSDYLKLNHSKWKITIEPNTEWIMQKWVINSITSTWNNLK